MKENGPNDPTVAAVSTCFVTVRDVSCVVVDDRHPSGRRATGCSASAAAMVTDDGVTVRVDSPYEPVAPCSTVWQTAPVGMPSMRAL